jgi:hypothetical protein
MANHWIAARFVSVAAKNSRSFPSLEALSAALIYNYVPRYNGIDAEFMQQYFFPAAEKSTDRGLPLAAAVPQ